MGMEAVDCIVASITGDALLMSLNEAPNDETNGFLGYFTPDVASSDRRISSRWAEPLGLILLALAFDWDKAVEIARGCTYWKNGAWQPRSREQALNGGSTFYRVYIGIVVLYPLLRTSKLHHTIGDELTRI